MITERTIINALIIAASLILVPFIVSSTLTVDYAPAFFVGSLVVFILAFFFLKDNLCICPLLGFGILGALNFLPLALDANNIACIILVVYYITGYVVIRQKRISVGKPRFFWPIAIVTLIVLYHNHSLNFGIMGGSAEGGKPAFLIYLTVLAYFCAINVASPSVSFLSKVPLIMVILTALSSIPFLLSTYIPGLAPYLYSVTSSVNVGAYMDLQQGSGEDSSGPIGRLAVLGPLGASLELFLLCYYPIGTWIRPERWWVLVLSMVCTAFVIASGYRSAMFGFFIMIMAATWCYYSWRSIILPATAFFLILILVIATSNNIIHLPVNKLPLIAQRSLSFLPADWDTEAIESGKISNSFRLNIQSVYINEYMFRSPIVGNGFSINTKEFDYYNDAMNKGTSDPSEASYNQAKTFIEGKLYHTGWISVYDCVGVVGFAAFLFLAWNEIRVASRFVFGPKINRRSSLFPFYVWILTNILTMMISFFTVFGDFKETFINLCVYAMVLAQLSDVEKATEGPAVPNKRKDQFEFAGLKNTQYGYGYQSKR